MSRFPGAPFVHIAAAAVAVLVAAPSAAAPSPAERRMIATVGAEQGRTLAMLERWVNQNSGSHNLAGVEAVGGMIRAELEPLGFAVRHSMDAARIRLTAAGKTNIIAATAVARGDLRALTRDQYARTVAKMKAIVGAPLPGATSKVSFDDDAYPTMAPTPGNRALLAKRGAADEPVGGGEALICQA